MPRKKTTNDTARVAAGAAAAAVNATRGGDASNMVELLRLNDDDDDDDSSIAGDILEDLEKIDADHGGSITWELYCDVPMDKAGQVAKLARSELRGLRDRCLEFGPGEYHVVARAPNGLFVKNTRRNIKISGLVRGANPPAPANPQMDPLTLMQMLDERAEKRRAQASRERMDAIKFWAPILAPIGVEMAKGLFNRGGGGESIKDLVAAMVGMKDLTAGDKSLDALLKGIELAQNLTPEAAAKGSTWPDMLATAFRELRPLAETLAQRRQPTPQTAPAAPQLQFVPTPQPGPAAAASNAASAAPSEADDMFKLFEPLLRKLVIELEEYSVNATEPALTAEALLAKVPRMVKSQISYEQLKEWLTYPQWWEKLSEFHPSLQPYQAYCDQVREELLGIVEQQQTGGQPDGGEGQE
jgi:hypothetical protein